MRPVYRSLVATLLAGSLIAGTTSAQAARPFDRQTQQVRRPGAGGVRGINIRRFLRSKKSAAATAAPAGFKMTEEPEKSPSFLDRMEEKITKFSASRPYLGGLIVTIAGATAFHNLLGDPQYTVANYGISLLTLFTGALVLRSQNKSGERADRRGELDLAIDIKAEKEIAALHEKLDAMGDKINRMAAALEAKNAVEQASLKQ